MSRTQDSGQRRGQPAGPMRFAGMGFELAAAIIGCTLAGMWVDYQFGTGRKGLAVGASVGIIGGLYNFIREAMILSKEQDSRGKADDSDRDKNERHPG